MGVERRAVKTAIIGLTGSIGSGKSYILSIFAGLGVPTQSSDLVAHGLLQNEAFEEVAKIFPSVVEDSYINRHKLGKIVFADIRKRLQLEKILHPLVRAKNKKFAKESGAKFVVIEIPLLFESGAESYCDYVIAINVSRETMQKRALIREKMTREKFEQIIDKQMPTAEKLKRADFVIENEAEHDTVGQVKEIIRKITEKLDGK